MNRFEGISKPLMWFMALLLVVFAAGCGNTGGSVSTFGLTSKAITAYSIAGSTWVGTGVINESAKIIAVTVPYGTNVTARVATFTTTGKSVKVGTTTQVSGTTTNDFTGTVSYIVTAMDGTTATYSVIVTVAAASSKAISAFSFVGYAGALGAISGSVSPYAIAVTVPYGTAVTALKAAFTTSGVSVKVGALAQTSSTTPNDFTSPVAYIVTAADGTTATYNVTVSAASITAKAITAYSLGGVAGTVNETAKTIAVTLPSGTSVTALVAAFATSGASVKVGTTAQISGTTANDFTAPVAYIVTAGDASTATYTVTVTVATAASKAITAYSLNGVTGIISGAASPYAISVAEPSGTVVTALVATFTTTGTSVKVGSTTQTSASTSNDFTSPVAYIVTAGDGSTATYNVTVTSAPANPTPPTLGEAGRFAILAYTSVTGGSGSAISNGDIGVTPAARSFMTGFTVSPTPAPNGEYVEVTGSTWAGMASTSYAPDDANGTGAFGSATFAYPLHYASPHAVWTTTAAMLTQAGSDETTAYNFLAADPNPGAPTQVCATELGGLTLTRGVYATALNVGITTGTLNLDAQGDPSAVWIFSIAGTLTTAAPGGNIVFVNSIGSAKNVYWRVAGATNIAGGTSFIGNIFDQGTIALTSGATVTGSLFSAAGSVTLIGNTITKP